MQPNDPNDPNAQKLNPWAHLPYSYEQGSSYGQGAPTSMFAPNQSGDQQFVAPTAPASVPQPSYALGPEGEPDAGEESKQFAGGIGQGVLAASQSGAKGGMMGGQQKKKKPSQFGGDQGSGPGTGDIMGMEG